MSLSRQQRRALERTQAKAARRQQNPNVNGQSQPAAQPRVDATPAPVAQHSTGPRTEAGKAISSQNALRHGLTSSCLVLPWENKADFDGMLNDLVAEHQPATITEQIMVREMAENYWRLNRCRTEEHRLLSQAREIFAEAERERDNGSFLDWQRCVDLSQRYATRFERNFHKSFRLLRTLQKERRAKEAEAQAERERQAAESSAISTAEEFVSQKPNTISEPPVITPDLALSPTETTSVAAGI